MDEVQFYYKFRLNNFFSHCIPLPKFVCSLNHHYAHSKPTLVLLPSLSSKNHGVSGPGAYKASTWLQDVSGLSVIQVKN